MAKFIVGSSADRVYAALLAAGVVTEPMDSVARFVIDLQVGKPAAIYIKKYADDAIAETLVAGLADFESEEAAA